MKKVFLGGTCNGSQWRELLKPYLNMSFFDPVVEDWTPECQAEEIKQREECNYCLYVITPLMAGVFAIAEVVDDSNKRPEKTILCVLDSDERRVFPSGLKKALTQVAKMVVANGGKSFDNLNSVARFLNKAV